MNSCFKTVSPSSPGYQDSPRVWMLVVIRKGLLEELGVRMKMGVELKLARPVW